MPAMLDDPHSPVIFRASGESPFPRPDSGLPEDVVARHVTLRDRVTQTTLIPFSAPDQVPLSLLAYLCDQLNKEIEKGDTYPMIDPMPLLSFGPYWFANFGAVMLLGDIQDAEEVRRIAREGRDWDKECLGSFYIKPNYPGRSSHVCNGGFLVTDGARNRGVGRLMGEGYLEWAPKLGYTYSVFNLVYETNVASCRIWDALGFKRIGRVKGCGNLKSYPNQLIDAIIYGRDLGPEGEDFISEERFERIKFYLKHAKYPDGADRAEKSRLRSAATHYKLLPGTDTEPEKLMLKGKEVVADPQTQYDVARRIHMEHHGGINKTTAAIAERYHWVRIKETVSQVIKNCPNCKEASKPPPVRARQAQTHVRDLSFERDYSVPPGENWLKLYGNNENSATTHEQYPQTPAALPPDSPEQDEDAPHEEDHQITDVNFNITDDVPVDPLLMDGIDHTQNNRAVEVTRQLFSGFSAQVFGGPMITPQASVPPTVAQQPIQNVNEFRRVTRRFAAAQNSTTTDDDLLAQQILGGTYDGGG